MVATTVGAVALESALSMGLSLAISFVIGKISDLVNAQENYAKANEEAINNFKTSTEAIKNASKLLEEKKSLENQLNSTNDGTKEATELKTKLLDIERQLAGVLPNSVTGYDEQGKAISANNKLIQDQINLKKQQSLTDAMKQLKDDNNGWSFAHFFEIDDYRTTIDKVETSIERLKKVKEEAESKGNLDDSERYSKLLVDAQLKEANYRNLIILAKDAGRSYKEIADYIGTTEDVVKN